MDLVNQPSSCSQRLRAGTSLWRDAVPGTEEGVISLPGQRTHDAAGPPIPSSLTASSGWEVGVASTHLDLWAKPNPVLEETQSHMPEPRARPGYPSPNLRWQQESRRPWAAPQVASPPSSPGGPT